ncbi:MAG TPA: hypothetical protein VHT52_23940 [Stellaceae bacterium]|jgi:hypothetical protein|nr:hypothetical protein [Stellaceae bacterium]
MRNVLVLGCAVAALALAPLAACAETLTYDPLHFSCSNCAADNGTFTPSNGTPLDIAAFSSPANSGDLILKILLPSNDTMLSTDLVTGTVNGASVSSNANLFSTTAWTSGSLELNYLGQTLAGGAPPNDITAFLPSTDAVDPGATGFFLLTLDLGQVSLNTPGGTSPTDLTVATDFAGGWILGDLLTGNGDVTTAQSAALFVQPLAVNATPIGATVWLFASGLAVFGMFMWKRKRQQSPSAA